MNPIELFEKLIAQYGPQNWWPGEGFEIAIGAILTQNTSWGNVEKAIENLRRADLLEPQKIIESKIAFLIKQIKPAGFYNQKAVYLKNLSAFWIKKPNPSRNELLMIKGIGEETADSILLYLLQKLEFVIDSYTVRISTRLGINQTTNKHFWKQYYQEHLPKDIELYNELHALLVIHAKNLCRKRNPLCSACFLQPECRYAKEKDGILI
ncbi:MAG: endonuclease [Candidatus Heimdallarchaeota archaeon]|nr:endonuclease [Candidatus Heimdallarchaeota archaeon]